MDLIEWGRSMISNRHCRLFQQNNGNQIFIEDNSGNGTFINQQTHLRKGETRILHSGDEICLISAETLRKKISSYRVIQMICQQFSFILVQSTPRKSCVNPRAMNYNFGRNDFGSSSKDEMQAPSASETSVDRRIETFYDIREVLGDGTSGQVRRAIHRQSGEERAIKIISVRRHVDVSIMEREVKLLQSLDHPYIVKLIDVFVRHGVAMYLVMELVRGGDLFDSIVDKQRYSAVEARRTIRRLLSAVHYLHHDSNIVHRDLKPENILCTSPTQVKLADFGLAKIVKEDGLKTFCGTPAYFAPEVLQRRHTVTGQGRYGKPADMWSLGVILYILLTGKPPFDPDMEESSKPFDVNFELDGNIWSEMPSAKELVQQMLLLDPKQRCTVRQACDHSWVNIDDGDTHRHPLEDPAYDAKMHLSNRESKANDPNDPDVRADSGLQSSNVTGTISETETSADQGEKVLRVDDTKILKPKRVGDGTTSPTSNTRESEQPIRKNEDETSSNANSEVEDADNTKGNKTKNEHSVSVSFSDCPSSAPRSPLTNLDFNQRSNEFRNRIIEEANPCSSSVKETERLKSPDKNGDRQVAVTPGTSAVKSEPELCDVDSEEDEKIEDPILSQFSSSVSSVESFSDSSDNENTERDQPSTNKRLPQEDKTNSILNPPKRAKICSSKQTTLNSWLVKKD
jgi:serine/threonine protein kinase